MCSDNIFEPKFFKPKMEALQLDPKKHILTFASVDIPAITKPEDVVIKVAFAGVCGTDLHVINGNYPCAVQPFTLGHEFGGTVYAVGTEVKKFKRGDRVGVDPNMSCGLCEFCHSGSYNLCAVGSVNSAVGIFSNGGWGQFCKVSSKQIFHLPSNISFKQAVLLEPLSCIYHAYSRIAPIDFGKSILIIGAGIIGNLFCCLLHHVGHRRVFLSEPEDDRREITKKLDTGFTLFHPRELQSIFSEKSMSGIDVIIECSGNGQAVEESFGFLNPGGKLCIFGVSTPETKISLSPFDIFRKEITIFGALVNPYTYQPSIGLMEAMGPRYIDYKRLGIKVYMLSQYKEAIDTLQRRKISKAVFRINSDAE